MLSGASEFATISRSVSQAKDPDYALVMRTQLILAVIVLLGACRSADADRTAPLFAADRAFCADTEARRMEGWLAAFDENGSQFDEQFRPVTGAAAIRAHMSDLFDDPANVLTWEPDSAVMSEAGNLGSTSGRWTMSVRSPEGSLETIATGRYFDVWRKLPDGAWKLVVDIGEADERVSARE